MTEQENNETFLQKPSRPPQETHSVGRVRLGSGIIRSRDGIVTCNGWEAIYDNQEEQDELLKRRVLQSDDERAAEFMEIMTAPIEIVDYGFKPSPRLLDVINLDNINDCQ